MWCSLQHHINLFFEVNLSFSLGHQPNKRFWFKILCPNAKWVSEKGKGLLWVGVTYGGD